MLKEIGLQLFSIRDFMKTEEDIRESFQKMRKYGYTQAQTARCAIPYGDFGRIAREEGIQHGTYYFEQQMLELIKNGETE